jgi:hypothetical protein
MTVLAMRRLHSCVALMVAPDDGDDGGEAERAVSSSAASPANHELTGYHDRPDAHWPGSSIDLAGGTRGSGQ